MIRVVVYNMDRPDIRVVVAETNRRSDARRIMKLFRSVNWKVGRRPDIDTFDDRIVLTFEGSES